MCVCVCVCVRERELVYVYVYDFVYVCVHVCIYIHLCLNLYLRILKINECYHHQRFTCCSYIKMTGIYLPSALMNGTVFLVRIY